MDKKSPLSAFLTVILIGGLALANAMRFGTVQASTGFSGIPKPSIPEFTLQYVLSRANAIIAYIVITKDMFK